MKLQADWPEVETETAGNAFASTDRPSRTIRVLKVTGLFLLLCLLGAGGLVAAAVSGIGKTQIERAAQRALSDFAGEDMTARFGGARLVLHGIALAGLELTGVELETGEGRLASADRLHFGVALWPLLRGQIELTGARLANAHVSLVASGAEDPLAHLRNERGLIDPDAVARELHQLSERAYALFAGRPGAAIELDGLVFDPDPDRIGDDIVIEEAVISKGENRIGFTLAGVAGLADFTASGEIRRDAGRGVSLHAELVLPRIAVDFGMDDLGRHRGDFSAAGRVVIVAGRPQGDRAEARVRVRLDQARLSTREGTLENGIYEADAILEEGAGKVEFTSISARVGRNLLQFHGAFGPAPEEVSAGAVYRYELVSDGSRLAPSDSPEPALAVLARIAGIVNPDQGRITADEIGVRTTHGEVLGNGALVFAGKGSPAAFLTISATDIPVSHAKQLWPWISAHGARNWVLANVFGGTLRKSEVTLSTRPGQLGSGIPLGPGEVSGRFELENTRFNLTGDLPPVRDANGWVEFAGRSVRIGLTSGTAFMASGRSVDGSNGTLDIEVVRGKPLIGTLELDISGDADAITELAAYKPIEALRFIDLAPADFSGRVRGHVSGTIPLDREVDRNLVDWNVHLDYEALDIARPFDGQLLTDATGSIRVDRDQAVIEARGFLNGLPAEFSLVEPLDRDQKGRRDVRLELDDKARARLLPGLNAVVSGRVPVSVTQTADGGRKVHADLTRAELRFPWVGWRKGSGVEAEMTFVLREAGDATRLEDLEIRGDGFRIAGTARLAGGRLAEAALDHVQLNRDDRFRLNLTRQGAGYRIDAAGARMDVRSLVKQVLSDAESQEGENVPVRLSARLDAVAGFGGEELRDVTLEYGGTGGAASDLSLSALTRSGQAFQARMEEADGRRGVQLRSADAGAILRFLDIYPHMAGGRIELRLGGRSGGPLVGQIDARNFELVNEPRLKSLVSSAPAGSPSLDQATQGRIQTSRARFEHAFAKIEKGRNYLSISEGVLRGPEIGSTFQGTLYDAKGQISVTGTFMPAYGLNRIFAEIPFFGIILGNGRDRGLIGITYKLSGDAKSPQLTINPISAIAPGVFRNIFQFQ